MSEFVYLFRASLAGRREAMGTPERAQRSLQAWLAWIRELEAKGHLKDPGQPLEPEGRVVRGPEKVVTDGPYVEAKDRARGRAQRDGAPVPREARSGLRAVILDSPQTSCASPCSMVWNAMSG